MVGIIECVVVVAATLNGKPSGKMKAACVLIADSLNTYFFEECIYRKRMFWLRYTQEHYTKPKLRLTCSVHWGRGGQLCWRNVPK